jgi:predicted NodU family carbamoyl transferase
LFGRILPGIQPGYLPRGLGGGRAIFFEEIVKRQPRVYIQRRKMQIIGISAYYHDSAATLVIDGEIVAADQEERFSRKKHDANFPKNAIAYCLKQADIGLQQVDQIVFYDKPLVKFERLLETYLAYAPKVLNSFISAMPIWLKKAEGRRQKAEGFLVRDSDPI